MTIPDISAFSDMNQNKYIVNPDDIILVTGAAGFIGSRVVRTLLSYGFKRVRCFTRSTSRSRSLETVTKEFSQASVEIVKGNLLSRDDCKAAADRVSIVYHLPLALTRLFLDVS